MYIVAAVIAIVILGVVYLLLHSIRNKGDETSYTQDFNDIKSGYNQKEIAEAIRREEELENKIKEGSDKLKESFEKLGSIVESIEQNAVKREESTKQEENKEVILPEEPKKEECTDWKVTDTMNGIDAITGKPYSYVVEECGDEERTRRI